MGKKSKRTSLRVFTLLFMLIVGMAGEHYISVDPVVWNVRKMVSKCNQDSIWKYEGCSVDHAEKRINIYIWYYEVSIERMSRLYSLATEALLENEESAYQDYTIDFIFETGSGGRVHIWISNVNKQKDNIYLDTGCETVLLKTLAQYFPEVSSLSLEPDYFSNIFYESIDEVAGFHNLKYFHIEPGITKEEKRTILSIFRDCEVHCKILKEEAPSLDLEEMRELVWERNRNGHHRKC